jgi:hypothetical protein
LESGRTDIQVVAHSAGELAKAIREALAERISTKKGMQEGFKQARKFPRELARNRLYRSVRKRRIS